MNYKKIVLVGAVREDHTIELIEQALKEYPYFVPQVPSRVPKNISFKEYAGKTIQVKNKTGAVMILMDDEKLKQTRLLLGTSLINAEIHSNRVDVRCPTFARIVKDCLEYIQQYVRSLSDMDVGDTTLARKKAFLLELYADQSGVSAKFNSKLAHLGDTGVLVELTALDSAVRSKLMEAVQPEKVAILKGCQHVIIQNTDVQQPIQHSSDHKAIFKYPRGCRWRVLGRVFSVESEDPSTSRETSQSSKL